LGLKTAAGILQAAAHAGIALRKTFRGKQTRDRSGEENAKEVAIHGQKPSGMCIFLVWSALAVGGPMQKGGNGSVSPHGKLVRRCVPLRMFK
jgi:hypothetical protein